MQSIEQRNNTARQRITEIHEKHAITYRHLSKMIGVHHGSLSAWKKGDWDFSAERLKKLESAIERYERLDD